MKKPRPLLTALVTGVMVGITWSQWEARAFIEVNRFRRGAWGFLQTGWDILPYHIPVSLLAAFFLLVYFSIYSRVRKNSYTLPPIDWYIAIETLFLIPIIALFPGDRVIGGIFYLFAIMGLIFISNALLPVLGKALNDREFHWWYQIPVMGVVWGLSWLNLPPPPILPPPGDAPKKVADTGLKVLMFGVDGADWQFLGPGVRSGQLPNMARLIESGSSGPLGTQSPAISAIVWNTIATGKCPDKHGIEGWVVFRLKGTGARFLNFPPHHFLTMLNGENRRLVNMTPLTSNYRRCRAIWNIVSGPGDKVVNVGWWATWPAEKVKGVMVTPYAWPFVDTVMINENLPSAHPPGSTFPDSLMERLRPLVTRASDLKDREFMGLSPEIMAKLEAQSPVYDTWYHAKDITFVKMFDKLLTDHPDYTFASVYIEGTDIVQHVFLRYARPEWFTTAQQPTDEEKRALGPVIPNYYKWVDSRIGELLSHADDKTVIVVISDHGTEAGWRDMHYSGDHIHGPPGIIILKGGPIKKGAAITCARVEDVAPTLLYLLGYPIGDDMDGKVVTGAISSDFLAAHPVQHLPTLDCGFQWGGTVGGTTYDRNLMEKLKAIGYL